MCNYSNNSKRVLYEIIDNGNFVIIYCKLCQKQLDTYKKVRYHFSVIHEISDIQYSRVSKVARLLK
jgi:hypothetical protein